MTRNQVITLRVKRELADRINRVAHEFSTKVIATSEANLIRDAIEIGLDTLQARAEAVDA